MQRLFVSFLFIVAFSFSDAQTVSFNEMKELQLKEVVLTPNLTTDQVFVAIQSLLSDWHPNTNSKSSIDYSDLKTGTIITKGHFWLGFYKSNMICGYHVLADYSCTIRIKKGRSLILIKVPSVTLHWSADNTPDEKVPVEHVYPTYDGYKTVLNYTKKPLKEFGSKVPNALKNIYTAIVTKITGLPSDDDF